MSSSTLAFSSSSLCPTTTSKFHPQKQSHPLSLSLSKPNFNFLSSSFQRLSLSPLKTPTFTPFAARDRDRDAEVIDAPSRDPQEVIEEIKQMLADSKSKPKPEKPPAPKVEEIFAVVMIGSRQYIVFPGRWIYTQRLKGANVDDKIVLNKVLLVGTKNSTYIGKPVVTNAAVHAVVEEQCLDKKVIVFKYKKKKNYRRNIGHRQPITRIKITGITGFEDYPVTTLESQPVSS